MFKCSDWIVSIKVFALHVSQVDDSSKLFITIFWRSGTKLFKKVSFYGCTGVFFRQSDILLLLNFLRFASLWKEQRLKQFRTICVFDICQSSACSPPLRSFIIIFMERDLSDSQNSPHKGRGKTFGLLHKMINVLFSSKCNSKTNLSP